MNTKHTPGPWAMSRDAVPEWHVQTTIYAEASGERVATAFLAEENAQLIAAAPDLLACCERALNESARVHGDFYEQLQAAIARARGK